ncbi:MAG: hypothetical protein WC069_04490 [Candidatus Shapirobacteria bacterium]
MNREEHFDNIMNGWRTISDKLEIPIPKVIVSEARETSERLALLDERFGLILEGEQTNVIDPGCSM